MKKLYYRLNCKKGEIAISTAVIVLVFAMLFSLSMSFFSAYTRISTQNTMAYETMRYAEIMGRTGGAVTSEARRIQDTYGFDAQFDWTANHVGATDKVQLGEAITLTITSQTNIGIGGVVKISVPIKSRASGRSEVHWK